MLSTRLVQRAGRAFNRRSLMRSAAAAAFGTFAAVAVGRPRAAIADEPCTGPHGTGSCGCACRGSVCSICGGGTRCVGAPQFCGGACWSTPEGGRCCDCACAYSSFIFYCYCYGL